jgi:FkbM family methyltransferase
MVTKKSKRKHNILIHIMIKLKHIVKNTFFGKFLLSIYVVILNQIWNFRSIFIRNPIYIKDDYIYLFPNSHITRLLFLNKFEETERKFISSIINSNSNIVNIGANIGLYTVLCAHKATKGQVYSFEPEFNNFQKLLKNIQLNNLINVRTYNCALGSEIKKMNLYRDVLNPKLDTHYTLINNSKTNNNLINTIDIITLDSLFDNVIENFNLLIMDVNGYESEVLIGGSNFLKNNQGCVFMIEVTKNHTLIFDTMKHNNFLSYKIDLNNELILIESGHGNIIFKKN